MRQPEVSGFAEALRDFQALLIAVAHGHTPNRSDAMAYTRLRDQLVQAGPDAGIPGFVHQCLSIASFKTFIGLYHSQRSARQAFIESSFARSNRAFDRRPMRAPLRGSDVF
jgi:hypothetical protein